MKTYSKASDDVLTHIANMQSLNHPKLKDVTVDALFAFDEEHSGPVLRHQGYGAAAVVRITPLRDRALGTADAVITVDRATWLDLTAPQRNALIDHELQHLYWELDGEGHAKSDGLGRPKLSMRRHDLQIGFFTEILERHGDASFEARMARQMLAVVSQAQFDFGHPSSYDSEMGEVHDALDKMTGGITARAFSDAEPVDELYTKACELVRRDQTASISFLQHQLRIGYNRAARLLDAMEADGLVGPLQADGRREVSTGEVAPPSHDLSAEQGMDPELEAHIQSLEKTARQAQTEFTGVSEHGAVSA